MTEVILFQEWRRRMGGLKGILEIKPEITVPSGLHVNQSLDALLHMLEWGLFSYIIRWSYRVDHTIQVMNEE